MAEVLRLPAEDERKRRTARQKAIKFGRTLVGKKAVISKAIADGWHRRKGRKVKPRKLRVTWNTKNAKQIRA